MKAPKTGYFALLLIMPCVLYGQGIIVDHTSVVDFEHIPTDYAIAAANLRMLFMDRSVGGNIEDYLDCLASSFSDAPSRCKRYTHRDSVYAVEPSVVMWNGVWDRKNWQYEFWPGCSEDAICFIDYIEPRIDSFDVVGFQFSYLAVSSGSKLNDPGAGFFSPGLDKNTAESYAAFARRHPDKTVIWWTTSLARSIGTLEADVFNEAMREHAVQNNLVLFDVADILSHDPDGNPCYDNRDGISYLGENNPDDGMDLPAICPQYTTETEGGHLGSISAGGIRVAKAFWVLMARIAGWEGTTNVKYSPTGPSEEITVDIAPNPVHAQARIIINAQGQRLTAVNLTDMLGRTIRVFGSDVIDDADNSGTVTLNCRSIPEGLFFIHVMTERRQIVKKLLVTH